MSHNPSHSGKEALQSQGQDGQLNGLMTIPKIKSNGLGYILVVRELTVY